VKERERDLSWIECLLSEAEEDRRVLSNGIKQDGTLTLGDDFAQDVNAFRLKLFEVAQSSHYRQISTK
jgi:hypothetical protein